MPNKSLIVIVGPTAVGKTRVSVELALKLNCKIINADSRQLFKEMSIGTAKPTMKEMKGVDHFFVDDRSVKEEFSAGIFEKEALAILEEEYKGNDLCIMTGGSGLYIDAVCLGLNDFPGVDSEIRKDLMLKLASEGSVALFNELKKIDPAYAREIEENNSQRIVRALEIYYASGKTYSSLRTGMNSKRNFKIQYIGLELPREELYDRINNRMDDMIEQGLFEEALGLIEYRDINSLQTVGYNEIFQYQDGLIDKKEAIRILKRNSRRYSKRQLTWFKRNKEITWFSPNDIDEIHEFLMRKLHT